MSEIEETARLIREIEGANARSLKKVQKAVAKKVPGSGPKPLIPKPLIPKPLIPKAGGNLIEITSTDGTAYGTRIKLDGIELQGVTEITFKASVEGGDSCNTVTITLRSSAILITGPVPNLNITDLDIDPTTAE